MSVQQMVAANGAMSMSPDQLHSRRDELLARTGAARLSDSDRTRLAGAHTDDDLRKTLTDIASKETIKTEGEKTRQTMADLKQAVENIGQLLVVPLNAIREAVVGVAKFFGVIDQDKADQLMGKPEAEVLSRKRDELDKRIAAERAKPAIGGPGQAGMRRNDALLGSLEKQRAEFDEGIQGDEQAHPDTAYAQAARREAGARNQQVAKLAASPSQFDDLFDAAAQKYGVRSSDLKLLAAREAGMNPGARHVNSDGSVDLGIMQHNSKYLAQRGLTADDAMDPSKAIPEGAKLWAQLLKESGGDRHEAFRRYNGGARHLPSSDAYANDQMASSAMVDAANDAKRTAGADSRLPGKTVAARAAAGMERGATVQHAHNLNVTLTDPLTGRTTTYPAIPLHDGNPTPNGSGVSADQEWWRPVAS
jgi:soluble lytic murein transglycosylase-like protein